MNDQTANPPDESERLPTPVVPVEEEDQDGFDLRDILGVIAAGKWIIGWVTFAFTALAVVYVLLWPATYSADTLIQVNQFPTGSGQAAAVAQSGSLIAPFLPTGAMAAAEVEIMTSRAVLLPVIHRKHLNVLINKPIPVIGKLFKPKTPPPITVQTLDVPDTWKDINLELRSDGDGAYTLFSPEGRPVVHGKVGTAATALDGKVKVLVTKLGAKAGRSFSVMRLYDSEAYHYLQENLTATQLGATTGGLTSQTGVVQLELEGTNPYGIRNIVNAISDQYIQENIAAMAEQAQKSLKFVNSQLPVVNQKFITAEQKLAEYEQKYGVIDIDAQTQAALQQIVTYESQLTQLELNRITIAQQYTTDFPGYAAIVNQEQQVRSKIDALNGQLRQLPQQEQGYIELKRDTTVYGELYQALLATAQDLEVTEAGTVGTARIVDQAVTPYEPVWPIIPAVIAIGIGLGLIFGVIAVLLKSALSRGVLDATELERTFGLPVYAIIPHSRHQQKNLKKANKLKKKKKVDADIPLLAVVDPQDPAIEALRSLRTSLNFAMWNAKQRIITFSGASPGVGKSFLSANVAHVLAADQQRVIVVDADMRKGHLHRYFRVKQAPGLSEVLSGQESAEAVIRRDPLGNGVDFVASGHYPPSAFDLVSGNAFADVVGDYASAYDLVIIDVPPILTVAEGLVISRLATANFLVVKAGGQTEREIHLALERMRHNGVRLMGFVFNDLTQRAASATFGRYAGGGYGYGYKYYRYGAEKTTENA